MRPYLLRAASVILPAVLLSMGSSGQQTSIRGSVPGAQNEEIRLMKVDDYISNRQVILSESVTDSTGNFQFLVDLTETCRISLGIGYFSFDLVAEREGDYVVHSDSVALENEFRPFYSLEQLPASVDSEPPPGLNELILSFNRSYNGFVMEHFSGIYQRRKAGLIDAFREEMVSEFGSYRHPYLDAYIEYRLAGTELAVGAAKRSELFNAHLNGRPVLLYHPEYMEFFNSFFDNYLYPDNRFIPRRDLYEVINRQADLGALLDTLGKDTTLRNEVIRELVCLESLGQLYRSNDFSRENILELLGEMVSVSKFEDHRRIAGNLLKELTSFQKGYPPPDFRLPDLEGNVFTLADFPGKPVYISFVATWSNACLQELELMKGLFEEYGDRVTFISIFFDRDAGVVKRFMKDKGYDWLALYNGPRYRMVHDYRLKTFPVFLLLDKKGKVDEYPAYKPSEVIRSSFDNLLGND